LGRELKKQDGCCFVVTEANAFGFSQLDCESQEAFPMMGLGDVGSLRAGMVVALLGALPACGPEPDGTETGTHRQALAPVSAPIQLSPSGSGTSRMPTFRWTAVADATEYVLAIEDGNFEGEVDERTFTAMEAGCGGGGTCAVSVTTAIAAGLANWRIRGGNADGPGPWTGWLSFAVCVGTLPPTGRPTPLEPSGAIETDLPIYRFTPVDEATKYFLWVDGPSGSNIRAVFSASEAGCVGAANDCAVQPTTPLASGLSNWWVQAHNSAGAGPWSSLFTVTFGGIAPPALAPATIEPQGVVPTTTPTYRWNAVPTATRYSLWVDDASGPRRVNAVYSAAELGCDAGGTCSAVPPFVLVPGLAHWWVRGENTMGNGPWSEPTEFTVAGGPPPPVAPPMAISPLDNIVTSTPSYSWSAVADATEYYLWVKDPDGIRIQQVYSSVDAGCSGGGTCSITPSAAVGTGLSTWWVRAQNSGGTSGWSMGASFNVGGGSPPAGVATLLAPIGTAGSATPSYEWTPVAGATEYLLWVNDAGGKRVQRVYTADEASCGDGTCEATPDTELLAGVVTWWIRAHNENGSGLWSEGASFAFCGTEALASAPVLISPNGAVSTQPTYEWSAVTGATDYALWVDDASGPAAIEQLFNARASGCADGGTCSATPTTPVAAGGCRFWVRAHNSMGAGPWSHVMAFTSGP
jgi:hypothetical protein